MGNDIIGAVRCGSLYTFSQFRACNTRAGQKVGYAVSDNRNVSAQSRQQETITIPAKASPPRPPGRRMEYLDTLNSTAPENLSPRASTGIFNATRDRGQAIYPLSFGGWGRRTTAYNTSADRPHSWEGRGRWGCMAYTILRMKKYTYKHSVIPPKAASSHLL